MNCSSIAGAAPASLQAPEEDLSPTEEGKSSVLEYESKIVSIDFT